MKTKSHFLRVGLLLGLVHSASAQPIITNPPQNQSALVGTTATFTVGATGAQPLSYQWRSYVTLTTFTNIPFGTEAALVLTNVQPTSRRFGVVVTDAGGLSATSSALVTLTVLVPPSITNQPTDQIVDVGATAIFMVTATGTPPLAYQWRFNDATLAGKTSTGLVLANVQLTNAGNYSVVVTYALGSVTSRVARLTFTTVHRIDRITANPDHTISLSLAGLVPSLFAPYYDIYLLEASTNLVDWSPLAMLQRTNDSTDALNYLDADATNFDQRFYRTLTNILVTPFPKPSGPYPVGTVSRLLTDPSRTNRYNIPTNSSFMVTFWYPGETRAGVLPEAYVENNAGLLPVYSYLNERNPDIVPRFASHALPGLALATNQTRYPVLIYSATDNRRQNSDKALELASHGYVVVAMDNPWASASLFPNGLVVHGTDICFVPRPCFQPILDNGIKDILFVLDELSRLNANDVLFAGRLDLERLGNFGLSLGCVFAAEFCRTDARCKALVLYDGGGPLLELLPDLMRLGLQRPFLSMGSTKDRPQSPDPFYNPEWFYTSLVLFTNAINNAFLFQIQDSSHASFGDRGTLISDPSLTSDPTPASRGMSQTIRACTLSFFDKYLKGEDDHLLDNPAAIYTNIINFQSK
jgi:hypothetical protein